MVARRDPGAVLDYPEHRPARVGGCKLARRTVRIIGVVRRKNSGRPHHATGVVRPARDDVLADLVDCNARAAVLVVAGYHASDAQRHISLALSKRVPATAP